MEPLRRRGKQAAQKKTLPVLFSLERFHETRHNHLTGAEPGERQADKMTSTTGTTTSTVEYVTANGTNMHHFAKSRGLPIRPMVDGDQEAGVVILMTREDVRAYKMALVVTA